ncbi:protein timeless homolog isoform X2 [Atheta coriaria]|uniref:protein timeless homolog isoform X2 n=1 Tax=Dalotia coriaria TaxID=877792 RepID=UPI0031F41DA1
MSSLLSAELVATCNSLGYYDVQQNKYYADENTLESVKDLIRYLKRDDESHDIRRQLGETKVVQTDLLPLLKNYWEQTDLFDVLIRLLVNLTTPALMLWNEEVPTERTSRNQYLQIEDHLRLYKQAFTDEAVWAVLSTRISKILEVDVGVRPEENGLIIERILILVRNILHVPADPDAEKRPDNDASVHDQVLWALHQSGMLDIILYVSSANEKAYYMHIIEIMCYMLREQNAKELASAALQRSQNEKMRDEAELLAIRHKETNKRQQKARDFSGSRHSRFGGTFVVKSMKSISDNELIYHKPLSKLDEIDFDGNKSKLKTPKNRAPLKSTTMERRSAFSIRLFLKEFCIEFLNGAYNTFMYTVKNRLSRQQAQKHDETYYLWAVRFFLEFNRNHSSDIKLVSETMSVDAFQYVQRQLEQYSEMMISDKKCVLLWAKRLHVALLAYRELIYTLCAMDKSKDEAVRASSRVIKSNIFYVLEYRELILHLMIQYNDVTMTAEYLRDVIETQHVFLKMFQSYCAGKSLLVEEQAKRKKKSAQSKRAPSKPKGREKSVDLEELWQHTSAKLVEYLDGSLGVREEVQWKVSGIIKERMPGEDGKTPEASDLAKLGVQVLASENEFEEAIALMLESRELYPEIVHRFEDTTEQLEEFRAVFFTIVEGGLKIMEDDGPEPEEENNFEDEEDELEHGYEMQESDLKFEDFGKRLAHPKIVRACALALRRFEANSLLTNHCIVKLLHRIAFDSKMPTMLFQVSIFRVFQRIYEAKTLPQNKELVKFATYVIRQFFHVAQTNANVYMEALFWKSAREAIDIEDGYSSYNDKSKALAQAWSEHEEDELRRLFVEHQQNAIERDVVDWIVDNLVDNSKTRRAVLKKLKAMYLLVDYKAGKKSVGKVPMKQWSEEEEEQLRELFAQFAEAMDPLTCIMERLNVRRTKNRIVEKCLELGLVTDKKELRKKRIAKGKSQNKSGNPFQYAGDDINSEDDSNSDSAQSDNDESENESFTSKSSITNSSQAKIKTARKTQTENKKKSKARLNTSIAEITRILIDLASGDLKQGIDWLKDSIEDAAEDWNDISEDDEGVPLVPILEYSIAAMDNPAFLGLLRALNIQEPSADGQIT